MSKYTALTTYLQDLQNSSVRMSFYEIEGVLGLPLPKSARKHQPWWANDRTKERQTNAWLSVGWKTENLDLECEQITFRRID